MSTLIVDAISDGTTTKLLADLVAGGGQTTHWYNIDQLNTTINGSHNQASWTEEGTGFITSNFTNNYLAVDYAMLATGDVGDPLSGAVPTIQATTQYRMIFEDQAGTNGDGETQSSASMGTLA